MDVSKEVRSNHIFFVGRFWPDGWIWPRSRSGPLILNGQQPISEFRILNSDSAGGESGCEPDRQQSGDSEINTPLSEIAEHLTAPAPAAISSQLISEYRVLRPYCPKYPIYSDLYLLNSPQVPDTIDFALQSDLRV